MSEEITVTIGEVTVTYNPDTGAFKAAVPGYVATGMFKVPLQIESLDPTTKQPTGDNVAPEVAIQIIVCRVISYLAGAIANVPGVPPSDARPLEQMSKEFDRIGLALQAGTQVHDAKTAVNLAVKTALGAVGDFTASVVVATMMAAAGYSATSWSGPGATAAMGISLVTGFMISEFIATDARAAAITDMLFLGYEAVSAWEHAHSFSFTEAMTDFGTNVHNAVGEVLFPDIPPWQRPTQQIVLTEGYTEAQVYRLEGDLRYNYVSFEDATGAITVNLNLTGPQDGGSIGLVQFFTIEGIHGTQFADTIIGSFAGNEIRGGAGDDYIDGGTGFDVADYSDALAGVVIDLRIKKQAAGDRGSDTLINIEGVIGSAFNDVLTGNDEDNTLIGGTGDDVLSGGGGDDLITAHWIGSALFAHEHDIVDGGSGFDTISFAEDTMVQDRQNRPPFRVTVDLTAGTAHFGTGFDVTMALTSIEGVIGSGGDDTLLGDQFANRLLGEAGADVINGGGGDDWIDGGAGIDVLNGGDGIDTLSLQSSRVGVTATLQSSVIDKDTVSGFENLAGSDFNDVLGGTTGSNSLWGARGNDYLDAGAGEDQMYGGDGNDFIVGGAGNDYINGGEGTDYVDYSAASSGVTIRLDLGVANSVSAGSDTLVDIENVIGSDFDDVIFGSAGNNAIHGGLGHDVILGLAGNDTIRGGAGAANELYGGLGDDYYIVEANDTIVELAGQGADTVDARINTYRLGANVENLMFGGSGDFTGYGNALNNLIVGGAGNDTLTGGGGNDQIFGGAGLDTVVLAGLESDYLIEQIVGGYRVTDQVAGRDGTLLLVDVERLSFVNGSFEDLEPVTLAGRGAVAVPEWYPDFGGNQDIVSDSPWWAVARVDLAAEWS